MILLLPILDPEYDLVPATASTQKRGSQCGQCGSKFEYGVSYGYYCGAINCPMMVPGWGPNLGTGGLRYDH